MQMDQQEHTKYTGEDKSLINRNRKLFLFFQHMDTTTETKLLELLELCPFT